MNILVALLAPIIVVGALYYPAATFIVAGTGAIAYSGRRHDRK